MKIHNLLFSRRIGYIGVPIKFVRFRKIRAENPLEHLCIDIKYIQIHGRQRNALLLTVIDACSRKVLTNMLRFIKLKHINQRQQILPNFGFRLVVSINVIKDFYFEAKAYHIQSIFAQIFLYASKSLLLSIGFFILF